MTGGNIGAGDGNVEKRGVRRRHGLEHDDDDDDDVDDG